MATTLKTIWFLIVAFIPIPLNEALDYKKGSWHAPLEAKVSEIDKSFAGTFGVFIKDLTSEEAFSYKAEEQYYIASVIKLFVLVEIARLIDKKALSWSDKITLREGDYRDGAGKINWYKIGSRISIEKLVEQMVMESDNAATDVLINVAGLPNIEQTAKKLGVTDLGPVTTLLDVRKHAYRQVHPLAGTLTAKDFIKLWKIKNYDKKAEKLTKMLKKPKGTFTADHIKKGYLDFYKLGYNSSSLFTVSQFLQNTIHGEGLSKEQQEIIVRLLLRSRTGHTRIRAGLPRGWKFAHKTGTQFRRTCDVGIAFGPNQEKINISICAQDFESRKKADRQYKKITRAFFKAYWDSRY